MKKPLILKLTEANKLKQKAVLDILSLRQTLQSSHVLQLQLTMKYKGSMIEATIEDVESIVSLVLKHLDTNLSKRIMDDAIAKIVSSSFNTNSRDHFPKELVDIGYALNEYLYEQ